MDSKIERFLAGLCAEVIDSAAVNHRYLQSIQTGDLPNVNLALQDFAFQYGLYSGGFTRYLEAVITNLSATTHQQTLWANLAEEQGNMTGAELPSAVLSSIAGCSHANLYQRFRTALGVDSAYVAAAQPCSASLLWRRQFLELCQMNEYIGIGAIGIGTELIVSHIYNQILIGLKAHSRLTMTQRVFFDLHSQCDEAHAAQILGIARDLAQNPTSRKQIQFGARMAIEMRIAFWDQMLLRAQNFPALNTAALASKP